MLEDCFNNIKLLAAMAWIEFIYPTIIITRSTKVLSTFIRYWIFKLS